MNVTQILKPEEGEIKSCVLFPWRERCLYLLELSLSD